jgi:hypothetical protein
MPGSLLWTHSVAGGTLNAAVDGALNDVQFQSWPGGQASVARGRALILGVLATMSGLGPTPPVATSSEGHEVSIRVDTSPRPENLAWQQSLARGLCVLTGANLAALPSPADGSVQRVSTVDGAPASGITDAAQLPPVAAVVAIVLVAGLVAGAVSYIAAVAADAWARTVESDSKAQTLAASLAAASQVLHDHRTAEQTTGNPIPYSEGELRHLTALDDSIEQVAASHPGQLSTVPNVADMTSAAAGAIKDVGSGVGAVAHSAAEGFGSGLGWIAAIAAALWLYSKR